MELLIKWFYPSHQTPGRTVEKNERNGSESLEISG